VLDLHALLVSIDETSFQLSLIALLRAQGAGWKAISNQLDCRVGTVLRVAQEGQKKDSTIPLKVGPVSPVISTSVTDGFYHSATECALGHLASMRCKMNVA
jgi:hypothetical protein